MWHPWKMRFGDEGAEVQEDNVRRCGRGAAQHARTHRSSPVDWFSSVGMVPTRPPSPWMMGTPWSAASLAETVIGLLAATASLLPAIEAAMRLPASENIVGVCSCRV